MKLKELLEKITPGRHYVGAPIRNSDTIGINVQHDEDGGESFEETIAEVLPSSRDGNQQADAAYLAHCANHLPKAVEALREADRLLRLLHGTAPKFIMDECAMAFDKIPEALAAAEEVEGI